MSSLEQAETLKRCFKATFDSREGRTILAWIAKECGQFETDPTKIKPELQAFFNRLLWISGLPAPQNCTELLDAVMNISAKPYEKEEAKEELDDV